MARYSNGVSGAEQAALNRQNAALAERHMMKVEDERERAAEFDRQQRVKEANLAAFDAAQEERESQRGISAFSADGQGGFHWSGNVDPMGDAVKNASAANAQRVYDQYDAIVQNARKNKANKRMMDDATISSMMLQAQRNNGFVPAEMMSAVNAQLGTNLIGGNFTQDGNFVLYNKAKDANGSDTITPFSVASPEMQYGVLSRSGLGLGMQRGIYDRLSKKRTADQLAKMGIVAPDTKLQQKEEDIRANLMKSVMRSNDPSDFVKTLLTNKDYLEFASRGKPVVGEDGKPVLDETTLQPKYERLSPQEVFKNVKSIYDEMVKARDEYNNGIPGYKDMMAYFANPNAGQTHDEADEAARIERISRPQQLVYLKGEDGKLTATNGYVEDGKFFDKEGRLVEGAVPVNRNGEPMVGRRSANPSGGGGAGGDIRAQLQQELARRRAAKGQPQGQVQGQDYGGAPANVIRPTPNNHAQKTTEDAKSAKEAELERRKNNVVVNTATPEKPLSQTPMYKLPGALAKRGMEAVARVGDAIADNAGKAVDTLGSLAEAAAYTTPEEIAKTLSTSVNPAAAAAAQDRTNRRGRIRRAREADAEQGRRAQEYYGKKLAKEQEDAKDAKELDDILAGIEASMSERNRRRESIERIDGILARLENERKSAAASKKANAEDRKRREAQIANARRLRKLYESGDTDKIREKIASDADLQALLEEIIGE